MATDRNPNAVKWGRELKRVRRRAGQSQHQVARAVGCTTSHISNLEIGHRSPPPELLQALDETLGSNGQLIEYWEQLTRDARPAWLEELGVEIEQSDAVYDYCVITWPGYMQTPDYARVLVEQAVPWLAPEEAERRIAERVSQTQRMTEANRPMLWVVADESILWRRFGGASVTRDQLDHVMRLVEAGRVHLQFMQADAEHHPGNSGPFKLLSSTRRPDVLYTESTREGQLVTDTDDVVHYRMLFAQLQGAAMPVADTLDRLRNTVERLK